MERTRQVVVEAVIEVCGTDESLLVDTAELKDLEIDSLDLLEVAMIVEEKLDVVVDADHFDGVATLGDTVIVFQQLRDPDQGG